VTLITPRRSGSQQLFRYVKSPVNSISFLIYIEVTERKENLLKAGWLGERFSGG